MVLNIANALAAYKQNGGLADVASEASSGASGGASFTDVLKGVANEAVGTLQDGEKAAAAGAVGKMDIASVVTAINNAEVMLQTVVAIRDKVIAAYQDITKTSI